MPLTRWQMNDEEWEASRKFKLTLCEAHVFVLLRDAQPGCVARERIPCKPGSRFVHVHSLRNKLRDAGYRILTVRGEGYKLTEVAA